MLLDLIEGLKKRCRNDSGPGAISDQNKTKRSLFYVHYSYCPRLKERRESKPQTLYIYYVVCITSISSSRLRPPAARHYRALRLILSWLIVQI